MSIGQLELPLFEALRSTPDAPAPEQDRTHPAEMVIQHCGRSRRHVSHVRVEVGGWCGCPGTPDLRDEAAVAAADQVREQIRQMDRVTFECGIKRGFHDPHLFERDGVSHACPGLVSRQCSTPDRHNHHRWWSIPDAFYWCEGVHGSRRIEDVDLP